MTSMIVLRNEIHFNNNNYNDKWHQEEDELLEKCNTTKYFRRQSKVLPPTTQSQVILWTVTTLTHWSTWTHHKSHHEFSVANRDSRTMRCYINMSRWTFSLRTQWKMWSRWSLLKRNLKAKKASWIRFWFCTLATTLGIGIRSMWGQESPLLWHGHKHEKHLRFHMGRQPVECEGWEKHCG